MQPMDSLILEKAVVTQFQIPWMEDSTRYHLKLVSQVLSRDQISREELVELLQGNKQLLIRRMHRLPYCRLSLCLKTCLLHMADRLAQEE